MTSPSRRLRRPAAWPGAISLIIGAVLTALPVHAAGGSGCTCSDGPKLEPGFVSYSENGDRETITRIETESGGAGAVCAAIWIARTEIHTRGTPYDFYLQRTARRERRFEGCGDSANRFVKRSKNYVFVFDSDSTSIREMRSADPVESVQPPTLDPKLKSNSNVWDAIALEDTPDAARTQEHVLKIDSAREFNRTSWVFSRKEVRGHYVGIVKDSGQNETIVPLKKTRKVQAGQLGQIEAADSRRAIVRFYLGSRIAKFTKARNAILRWYDGIGGPYKETSDDLYTALRAYIVEVSLDDIIEVNDYLDQAKTDRTRPVGL
jgi:hypothetical protein